MYFYGPSNFIKQIDCWDFWVLIVFEFLEETRCWNPETDSASIVDLIAVNLGMANSNHLRFRSTVTQDNSSKYQ